MVAGVPSFILINTNYKVGHTSAKDIEGHLESLPFANLTSVLLMTHLYASAILKTVIEGRSKI